MKSDEKAILAVTVIMLVASCGVIGYHHINAYDGDTYYYYLDGVGDDSGWYTAQADNVLEGFEKAMKDKGIDYKITSGFVNSIGDNVAVGNMNFAIYEYTSKSVESPYSGYFFAGPMLSDATSNIIYISYTPWSFGAQDSIIYDLNPTTTTSDVMSTGPFAADSGYKPLSYSNEYWFYFDGFGDSSGWHKATGNASDALVAAAAEAGLKCTVSGGWINIEGYPGLGNKGIGMFGYCSVVNSNAWAGYFFAGPIVTDVASNIIYLSYGEYTMDANYNATYHLNPLTSAQTDIMTTGPFATA